MKNNGFTLIELLVAISIISILSVIGFVSFQGIRNKALDAKVKSDLNAIKKAYEAGYDPALNNGQGGYKSAATQLAGGQLPKKPDGTDYTYVYGPDAPVPNNKPDEYKVQATLTDGSLSISTPSQGTYVGSSAFNTCDKTGGLNNNTLIVYWNLDDSSGFDSSGGNNPGTVGGSWSSASSSVNADFKKALNFNNGWIISATAPVINASTGFTISLWVNFSATNFNNSQTLLTNNQILLRKDSSTEGNKVSFFINIGGALEPRISWNTIPLTGTFYHVVASWDGTIQKLYINGNSVSSQTRTGSLPSSSILNIGNFGSGGAFYGIIDDIRLYNRALTDDEVKNLNNGGKGCFGF